MNGFKKLLAATFLSVPMLFTGTAQAMEIRQFDKMTSPDRAGCLLQLTQAAERF
jgi:hypothetical protein